MSDTKQCGSCGASRGMSKREKMHIFGPQAGRNGVIELGNWEGCFTPYTGARRNEDVYVVGYGTEHERLFDTHSFRDAKEYVKSHEPMLELFRESSTRLCDSAIRDLFGE